MKKEGIFILTIIVVFVVCGKAQTMGQAEADDYFSNKRFGAVWTYYEEQLKTDPSDPDLNFKMGVCYLNSRSQKEKAFDYFKKAMPANQSGNSGSAITFKLLADACYLASNFDEAIINYEKHAKELNSKKGITRAELEEVDQKIEMCRMGKELKELKELVISMANQQILEREKHSYSCNDSSCVASPDTSSSLSISGKEKLPGKTLKDGFYFEINKDNSEPHFSAANRTLDTNSCLKEATVASSADGQIILIYRADKEEGNLYVSGLTGNVWSAPEKLNKIINNKGWEPNEFVSADGNTLYFASAREGGFGGKDIYKCTKLANGDWSKAINLGPVINTSFDEVAPFIHPNLTTLYFSSNRYKAKEGMDIFTSTLSDSGIWIAPVMVGYRVHKPGEYAFKGKGSATIKTEMKQANIENKKKGDEKENYVVTFVDPIKTPLTMIKGRVVDKDGKIPDYVEITVTNNETGEVLGIYNADNETGKYAFILPSEKNNNITFEAEGYLYHTENIDISKSADPYRAQNVVELVPLEAGSRDVLNNLFFEEKKASLTKSSNVELDKLYDFLSQKEKVIIELSICVSKECTTDDARLAEDKMQSIINYLFEKGIDKERVTTKVYRKSKKSRKKSDKEMIVNNESGKLEIKILNI